MGNIWDDIKDLAFGVGDRILDYKKSLLDHGEDDVYGPMPAMAPTTNWSNPQASALPSWLPWAVVAGLAIFLLKGK
jgi:hypothetical protein